MAFPVTLYAIEVDGKLQIFDAESKVAVPVDAYIPVATYQLTKEEDAKREITLSKRARA